jgi:uncharacterized protein (TIGR02271 family)
MGADDTPTQPYRVSGPASDARTSAEPEATTHVERVEERLVPDVELVQAGQVVIRKRTVVEPESIELQLSHDELELDRRKVERLLAEGEQAVREAGDETVVLIIEERLEVRKVPWVVEEIHVRRRLASEPRTITDSVRKERVEVIPRGDVEVTERDDGAEDST